MEQLDACRVHEVQGAEVDDDARTERAAAELPSAPGGVAGIYNLGAGNAGLIAALQRFGMAGRVRVIAHELTAVTRAGLETGAVDVVIDQNPDGEISAAVALAREDPLGHKSGHPPEPIEIGILLRYNIL